MTRGVPHEDEQAAEDGWLLERAIRLQQLAELNAAAMARRAQEADLAAAHAAESAHLLRLRLANMPGPRVLHLAGAVARAVAALAPAGSRRRAALARLRGARGGSAPAAALATSANASAHRTTSVLPDSPVVVLVSTATQESVDRSLAALGRQTRRARIVLLDVRPRPRSGGLSAAVPVLSTEAGESIAAGVLRAAGTAALVAVLWDGVEPAPGWLEALVGAMDDPANGLVGSRTVYPDGRIHQAGGVVFADGSLWHVGREGHPEDFASAYRRVVDWCYLGAAMVRRDLLDCVVSPADRRTSGHEDASTAWAVRARGMRVVYEPAAVAVVDEPRVGADGSGQSSEVAQEFLDRWGSELAEQRPRAADSLALAARARQGHRTIVVIDHYVPRWREDAGSVRMVGLLRALRAMGYRVLFVPDDRERADEHRGRLADLGVEVVYGSSDVGILLQEISSDIDAVIASRVGVAAKYLTMVRAMLPAASFVFDTVDLHFLREQRADSVRAEPARTGLVTALREIELALVRSADVTLVVSTYEQNLLAELAPGCRVEILPTVHELAQGAGQGDLTGRDDILFVGSFSHGPNADAMGWFVDEILPRLVQLRPAAVLTIVGRGLDPEIAQRGARHVRYLGWVADLEPLYRTARVVVAPLRFGAGVKGKIGEAMAFGVPVVTTSVGAEGMGLVHGVDAWIADEEAAFAAGIDELFRNDVLWSSIAEVGADHVDRRFGPQAFERALRQVLAPRPAEETAPASALPVEPHRAALGSTSG